MFVAASLDTQELIVKQVRRTSSKISSLLMNYLDTVNFCKFLTTFNRVRSKYQCWLRGGVGGQFFKNM